MFFGVQSRSLLGGWGGWGWGGGAGIITFVVDCKQTWCSSVYNHVRCWGGWGGGAGIITFVVDCKQTWCSSVCNHVRCWGGGGGWGLGGGAGIITFVVDCKQTWCSSVYNHVRCWGGGGGWGLGGGAGIITFVVDCKQTWCSSVYKESRSLLIANNFDVLRCTKNHVRCWLQTILMFFRVQRITFVVACMKSHKKKEKFQRPKAMKARGKTFRAKDVKDALKALRKTGWIHKAKHCSCGGNLVACPLTKSLKRGNGRAYLRCSECRSWYDVVAFSPLPTLKMPLPTLYECMQRYFHGPYAESVESCASFLGLSGSKTFALFKLWRALRTAECRCIAAKQKDRTLAGRPNNWKMGCKSIFSKPQRFFPVPPK